MRTLWMCITPWTIELNQLIHWMTTGVRYVHLDALCFIELSWQESSLELMPDCEHFILEI